MRNYAKLKEHSRRLALFVKYRRLKLQKRRPELNTGFLILLVLEPLAKLQNTGKQYARVKHSTKKTDNILICTPGRGECFLSESRSTPFFQLP